MKTSIFVMSSILFISLSCLSSTIPEGLWQTDCNLGLKKEQIIRGDQIATTELFYRDRLCTQKSFEFKTSGLTTYPQAQANSNQINFAYNEVELSVFVDEVILDFNQRHVCGISSWENGVSQKITGLMCALFNINKESPIPNQGDMKFGIYKIEEDKLFYGKLSQERNGSSELTRPLEYDLNYFKHLEIR